MKQPKDQRCRESTHAHVLLAMGLVVAAACRSPAPRGAAPPEVPPRAADGTQDAEPSSPQQARPLATEASAGETSPPEPAPAPAPEPVPPPSTPPDLPALPEPTTAAEWAEVLPHFRFLAEDGKCIQIAWSTTPCGPGASALAIMDEPPDGELNGYSVGIVRTLPRRASGRRLCVNSSVDITDLFPVWEDGASIRLDNSSASAVKDLTRERVDCEAFAEAQAEAARTGEPY